MQGNSQAWQGEIMCLGPLISNWVLLQHSVSGDGVVTPWETKVAVHIMLLAWGAICPLTQGVRGSAGIKLYSVRIK